MQTEDRRTLHNEVNRRPNEFRVSQYCEFPEPHKKGLLAKYLSINIKSTFGVEYNNRTTATMHLTLIFVLAVFALVKANEECDCNALRSEVADLSSMVYTLKSLFIQLSTSPLISAQACEHSSVNISCPDGKWIQIVDANYGRTDGTTCSSGPILTTTCSSLVSQRVVRANCENTESCRVQASNSVFGDPCVNTYKYLWVQYRCIPQW